jgi:hypothetical protein
VHVLDGDLCVDIESGKYIRFSVKGLAHLIAVDLEELPEGVEIPAEVGMTDGLTSHTRCARLKGR